MERIAKYLARCGVASSRRKAEELIREGVVYVNGKNIEVIATNIDPCNDAIKVHGKLIKPEKHKYLLFHKPKNVVTTKSDPQGRKTIQDYLPHKYKDVFPVGRLDKDSTGLLLLTNDGDLTYRLTHPKHEVAKTYEVVIDGFLHQEDISKIQRGLYLSEGKTQPAKIRVLKKGKDKSTLHLTIKEGKNRQIRRMVERMRRKVRRLHRIQVGPLTIKGLAVGTVRELRRRELEQLRKLL